MSLSTTPIVETLAPPRPGIPWNHSSSRTSAYAGVLPDRITIFRQAICAICHSEREVAEQVRRTVIHEIGHYFGIDDKRLRELGW
jgi:predicted Zn-dependent protease with MMP-like domain